MLPCFGCKLSGLSNYVRKCVLTFHTLFFGLKLFFKQVAAGTGGLILGSMGNFGMAKLEHYLSSKKVTTVEI